MALAVDAGGSYVKAGLVGWDGSILDQLSAPVRSLARPDGGAERDLNELWATTSALMNSLRGRAPDAFGEVSRVAITGHGNGAYFLNPAGQPTRPAVLATDTRATALVQRWHRSGVDTVVRRRTGSSLWPGQPGVIVRALRDAEESLGAGTTAIVSCQDALRAQFTGVVATEITAATTTGLYPVGFGPEASTVVRPDPEVAAALGIGGQLPLFPDAVPDHTVWPVHPTVSAELGLPAGALVTAGLVDNVATQLGSGITDSQLISVGMGTWGMNQRWVSVADNPAALVKSVRPLALSRWRDQLLVCMGAPHSSTALDWVLRLVNQGEVDYDLLEAAVSAFEARPSDPVFVPARAGRPGDAPGGESALSLTGLAMDTSTHALVAAVAEGICLAQVTRIEHLMRQSPTTGVVVSGGGSISDAVVQLLSDALGRPVRRLRGQATGLIGVGVAALHSGERRTIASVLDASVAVQQESQPRQPRSARLQDRLAAFRERTAGVNAKAAR